MNGRTIFSAVVLVAAIAAVVVLAGPDLFGGDDDGGGAKSGEAVAPVETTGVATETGDQEPEKPAQPKPKPEQAALPENPDDLPGSDPRALTHAANLRRALRVLERERTRREGVFDGLRVAPGRIDTTIDSANRKLTIQVRPDMKIGFRADSEFPNSSNPRWRENGLGAGAVDVTVPDRMLRRIDRTRGGSGARNIDYFVIRRDIIDHHVGYGAYFKRGPRPRIVILEQNGSLRAIG